MIHSILSVRWIADLFSPKQNLEMVKNSRGRKPDLLQSIKALSGKTGYCYATNRYLAENHNVSVRTIQNWLAELSRLGAITIQIDSGNRRKIFMGAISKNHKLHANHAKTARVHAKTAQEGCRNFTPIYKQDNKVSNTLCKVVHPVKKINKYKSASEFDEDDLKFLAELAGEEYAS
jgi:hypothetical protein